MNVLLMLATAKAVSGRTVAPVATSAYPDVPVQVVPSAKITVADAPGIASFTRRRSSTPWSAARVAALSTAGLEDGGEEPNADPEGPGPPLVAAEPPATGGGDSMPADGRVATEDPGPGDGVPIPPIQPTP
ncbi:MAG TPA: hypothetical protein VFP22_01680, partial [Candidatus Limnocylindrales bacterium]|nr:hypothetical protein [Candidatus Limnocylindrales bacterium]